MHDEWDRARADELAELVTAALPGEHLDRDELVACCWDDPGVVLGGDRGAIAAVTRTFGDTVLGWVRLLVVHPRARRVGEGRALLAVAEEWCRARGAVQVRFGGSAPFYLWPGVDVAWTAGLCLAEVAGYRTEGAEVNMTCATTYRAPVPPGVEVTRAVEDTDGDAVLAWCRTHWPHWEPELALALEHASAFAARRRPDPNGGSGGEVVGFACHSVNRAGWVGPMATRTGPGSRVPGSRVPGTGAALLGCVCTDLMVAGYPQAEIAWVGPVAFYAKAAGAVVSRVFRTVVKDLGP